MQSGVVQVGIAVVVDQAEYAAGFQQCLHRGEERCSCLGTARAVVDVVEIQRGKGGIKRAGRQAGLVQIPIQAHHVGQAVVG